MVLVLLSGTQGLALLCLAPTTKSTSQQVELSDGDDKHGSEIFAKTCCIHYPPTPVPVHVFLQGCCSAKLADQLKIHPLFPITILQPVPGSSLRSPDRKNIRAPHGVGPVVLIKERQGGCCGLRRACVRQK